MLKVSIIIPVTKTDLAARCIEAIRKNTGLAPDEYEIVTEVDHQRIGVAKMVKKLVQKTRAEMVCFLGQDTIPQQDFLKNALRAMSFIPDGWGMVSFNDNPTTTRSAAHWLASKKLLPFLDGEFFHTGYKHCFCDDELLCRVQTMNRYIYAFDAVVLHDHWSLNGKGEAGMDAEHKRVYAPEVYEADHRLFLARANNKWKTPQPKPDPEQKKGRPLKVVIGIPSGDMWHAQTAMNLVNTVIKTMAKGVQVAIVNPQFSLVEVARNEIVAAAREVGATHILTLDSDMTFPPETLLQLLSHDKDVVCCDAVRRRPPITQVLLGLDGKPLKHPTGKDRNPDMQQLVEVKGGSSAVQLVKMEVFDRLKMPYFLVEYNDGKFLGEDYYFTNKLRKAGIKVFCDLVLSPHIGHIGVRAYHLRDAESASPAAPEAVK